MGTAVKQANFLLPEDLLEELKKNTSIKQQSKVVAEALRREIKRLKFERAMQHSFGAWKNETHDELKSGTETFVRRLRKSTRLSRIK